MIEAGIFSMLRIRRGFFASFIQGGIFKKKFYLTRKNTVKYKKREKNKKKKIQGW